MQNKESDFTQNSKRLKYDALMVHCDCNQHHKAVSQDLLQRMSVFHKERVERKEIVRHLGESFSVAHVLGKEHIANRKIINLIKFPEDSLDVNRLKN